MEMQLDPACGIFRYIMADRYYEQVKAKNTGKQPMERQGDAQPVAMATPKPAPPAPVAPVAPPVPQTGPPAPPAPPVPQTGPNNKNKTKTNKPAPTNTKKGGKTTRKLLRKITN
jgi:hypothetical protein